MQKICLFGAIAALALAAPTVASARNGSVGRAELLLSAKPSHSAPARNLETPAQVASSRVELALLDTPAPKLHANAPRRIKTHKRFARRKSEVAMQFSESGATGLRSMIAREASANGVPVELADAVVRIESRYNPRATNGINMGLMQIQPRTARGMGFSGSPSALLQPEVNLRYGMKYLALAFRESHGDTCQTVTRYQSGHYSGHINRAYCAKAKAIMASR